MTRIATESRRAYRSQLRAEQAEETRARASWTHPASHGPGHRHPQRPRRGAGGWRIGSHRLSALRHEAGALAAVCPHIARRAGLGQVAAPESVEDFRRWCGSVFERLSSLGDEARVAMTSPASEEARRTQMPARYAMSRRFVATVMPGAAEADRDRLARVLAVLASSSSMRTWLDHLGSSVDEAAEDVDWLIRKVLAAPRAGRRERIPPCPPPRRRPPDRCPGSRREGCQPRRADGRRRQGPGRRGPVSRWRRAAILGAPPCCATPS